MQNITPCLWFDMTAEEAVNFYVSVFADSEIHGISRYPEGGPVAAGTALVVDFTLFGTRLQGLNGGPQHPFTDAISLSVPADTQEEVDRLWNSLTADGGAPGPCGWLTDRFGLSWQIVPTQLAALMSSPDAEANSRVMIAMMGMSKLIIAELQAAHEGP